jgi:hypothetical protein
MITVQAHMPFAGKQRKPGDVLTKVEWMTASDTARRALLNQGMVVIGGKSAQSANRATADLGGEDESTDNVVLLLQGISAKLDRLLGANGLEAPEAAAPKTRRKAGKRASKARK